jgi:hypothetical protein
MNFLNEKKLQEKANKNKFTLFEGKLRDVKLEKQMNKLNDGEYENSFDNINLDEVKSKKEVKKLNEFNNEYSKSKKFAHNEEERILLLKEAK